MRIHSIPHQGIHGDDDNNNDDKDENDDDDNDDDNDDFRSLKISSQLKCFESEIAVSINGAQWTLMNVRHCVASLASMYVALVRIEFFPLDRSLFAPVVDT